MPSQHITIAATERLARDLRIEANQAEREQAKLVWEAPEITGMQQFIVSLWEQGWPEERLLDPVTEAAIYRKIVTRSREGKRLLNPAPTAKQAQAAMALVQHYRLPLRDPSMAEQAEFHALQKWARSIRTHQREYNWLGSADMLRLLIQRLPKWHDAGELILPQSIQLVGFLDKTPLEARLLKTLSDLGVAVTEDRAGANRAPTYRLVRDLTQEDELRRVAYAIRAALDECDDPATIPRIAVVVPDINKFRADVERIFTPILAPHRRWPEHANVPPPWRWMKGTPLVEHPIADAALQILKIQGKRMALDDVTSLLLNKYIGHAHSESMGRASVDYMLRKWGSRTVQIKGLMSLAEPDPGRGMAPNFAERLQGMIEHLRSNQDPALPSVWSERFMSRLSIMGWPGSTELSSESWQAKEQVRHQLQFLAGLDPVLGSIGFQDALNQLTDMCTGHPFLPRTDYFIPVEIMDIWDTPGHHYDRAFIVGMVSNALPDRASPNPFLPFQMQKEAGIPACCADTQLVRAERLKETLSSLASEVVISCPSQTADGYHLTPSLLLGTWPLYEEAGSEVAAPRPAPALEYHESTFPPVSPEELPTVRGGVQILGAFARAPFFSAVESRLHLRPFPTPSEGISAAMQGEIIHGAMDLLWGELKDSATLHARADVLPELIETAVQGVFENPKIVPPYSLGPRLALIEKQRACRLIARWMQRVELERIEPFAVVAREIAVEGNINGLPVKLRIDRIDRVETVNGPRFLILDYKTGAEINTGGWQADTLTDPQLPIYATSVDLSAMGFTAPDGIGFAHITDDKCGAHLRANWTGSLDGKGKGKPVEDWPGQLAEWRDQLNANAGGFLAGASEVDYSALSRCEVFHGYLFGLLRQGEQVA